MLGTLQVIAEDSGEPYGISAARLRALLAVLLWRANQPVPADELAELVWDGAPPGGAADATRALVMRLRRALDPDAAARIVRRAPGYAIEISGDELDASRFEALTQQAGAAVRAGQWPQAAQTAARALGLWRGTPLTDVPSQLLRDQWVPRLEQLHVQALDWRIEADLHAGRHEQLIPELRELTARHPLREPFHSQLMLALYRCGHQAEALAAYQRARNVLVAELGVEPGPGLRDLHRRILSADPALALALGEPALPAPGQPQQVAPRELPAAVRGFSGRSAELEALTRLLDHAGDQVPGTVVISAIGGTAGVGKTALALHWAHQVAGRFPDGQLYVNLRGFDPSGVPATPAEAVRGFLNGLGVRPDRIPPAPDAQAGLYRSLLAGKRMLIVLDNARDEAQVRPLLPASPASLVLVTSRNQLIGLAAAEGARLLSLDVLTPGEAAQLLTARLGSARAVEDLSAVDEIARLCAHLPLALAVAAARAAARPRLPLAALAAELRDLAGRLDALDSGDPAASVRAVLSWSYSQLSPAAARLFRLLGLHAGPDISVPAGASLAAVDEPQARRLLRELARDGLITEHAADRYAFHDLLRAYASGKALECDPRPDRDAAIRRVLDHYLHTADHSYSMLQPSRKPLTLAPPSPGACPERPADQRQALAWFAAEHHVLLAAVTLAAGADAGRHGWQLPCAMTEYLFRRGYLHERVTIMDSALAAASRRHDVRGQAMSMRSLGHACFSTGDLERARAYLEQCLPLFRRLGDRAGEALAHEGLSGPAAAQGRYADALGHSEQALLLYRAVGDEAREAEVLNGIAWFHLLRGDYQQARAFCEQSLALIGKLGGCDFEYQVVDTLGYAELHLGDFAQAAVHFEVALGLCRDHGHRYHEGEILLHVGDARHAAGELSQARQAWQQALAIYDDIDHPDAGNIRAKLAGAPGSHLSAPGIYQRRALIGVVLKAVQRSFHPAAFPLARGSNDVGVDECGQVGYLDEECITDA
jgi:DNA-binding SARP family transcriptional activator